MMRVCILGGGQLAMMLVSSHKARRIFKICIVDPDPQCCINDPVFLAKYPNVEYIHGNIKEMTTELIERLSDFDIVTYEIETIDCDSILGSTLKEKMQPRCEFLNIVRNKYDQLQMLKTISPVPYISREPLDTYPMVIKLDTGGYDGQGVFVIHSPEEHAALNIIKWVNDPRLGDKSPESYFYQQYVDIAQEVAIVLYSNGNDVYTYPVVDTIQDNGICVQVNYPTTLSDTCAKYIEDMSIGLLRSMESLIGYPYCGVLAIEYIVDRDGKVWVNEISPRVHNSGHITLDICDESQFDNFWNCILHKEIHEPVMCSNRGSMYNVLGLATEQDTIDFMNSKKGNVYWYGKKWRPGRKLGHVNTIN